ncbi:GntR family transcriptional regulator [Paenibacillus sp. GCM10023252]|uniref:GntR family transcriptional regulator n=1 Tax=Paenibacillus sp. GCM10023252 TaxID=3252649 RepID=UPI0036064820
MTLSRVTTTNNWTQVYQILKENILQRKFLPNQKIAIPELAAQLGVSPTPIRDALSRLEAEGLIRTVPKVGTFVHAVDAAQAEHLIDARLMMENWVIEKWPSLPLDRKTHTISEMSRLTEEARRMLTPATLEQYLSSKLDNEFHFAFLAAAGNERISEMYAGTMNYRAFNLAGKLTTLEMCIRSVDQHRAIVEALQSGETARMKEAVQDHLYSSKSNLLTFIERSGGVL